ncbi:MAG: hypothetical protein KA260_08780 [Burkholderiales bacterium]|nr:hypothetical protein [Burkholderiales bacterium]
MKLKCLIPLRNAVAALAATILVAAPAHAAPLTFPGTGTGSIPDGSFSCSGAVAPLVISFDVNGMGAPLTDLRVAMNFFPQHAFAGDVTAVLKAPGGSPTATLFGRIGAVGGLVNGSGRHLSGNYTFVDPAISSANIWAAEAAVVAPAGVIPGGTYATTVSGPVATSPAPTTPLLSVFTSLIGAQINGTWTLELTDRCTSDQGGISVASLTLDSLPPPPTQFTLAPNVLDFGTVRVGDAAFRAFNVAAPSANGLDIEIPSGACTIGGADAGSFAKLFNAVTIPPGQSALLSVAFRSVTAGVKNAVLNCTGLLPSGVTPATISVPLTGTVGTPPPPANCFDVDGDGVMNPLVDGLFITRLQLGMTLPAAANGITFNAPRNTPLKVLAFLVASCGYPLTP